MYQRKGRIRVPDPVTEDVLKAIGSMGDQEVFGIKDVQAKIPRLNPRQVQMVLDSKRRQGALDHAGRGQYRKGGTRIQTKIPHGLVAEAVWAVLFTSTCQSMRLPEIVGEVETYIDRPGYSAYFAVANVLTVWCRHDHLERSGKYHEYAYRLREGVIERPAYIK